MQTYFGSDMMFLSKFFNCFFELLFSISVGVVRGSKPGKTVNLTEAEIRGLAMKSRDIFVSQPILLELEAPLKICGIF